MKKQTSGLKRNPIDKFYTKNGVVKMCYALIRHHLNIDANKDLIIEPSAGNGSFAPIISELCKDCRMYDLQPEADNIVKQDFLKLDYSKFSNKNVHIVGNPPFGRQSSLAIKFIRYSALFCKSISFILPKSFKKDSLQNKVPLNFHLLCQVDLPKNSFLVNEKEHDVPCVFQIWEKRETKRLKKKKKAPKNFKFVKENPDISFRRVGVNAGDVSTIIEGKSKQSHYFIKFTAEESKRNFFYNYDKGVFKFDNTVGPRSISKPELIEVFNKIL